MSHLPFVSRAMLAAALASASAIAFAQAGPANPMDQGKPGTPANQGVGKGNSNAIDPHPARKRNPSRRAAAASAAASKPAAAK